jgi:hypothetical protein
MREKPSEWPKVQLTLAEMGQVGFPSCHDAHLSSGSESLENSCYTLITSQLRDSFST